MRLLITGIHGFVGTHLVEALAKDHTLYGVDIVAPTRDGIVKTYSWEAVEKGQLPPCDAIIHLAGKAHDTRNEAEAKSYFKINTELTKKIYRYYLDSDSLRFIYFSSVKAVAAHVEGDILTEAVTPHPVGPYGASKRAAEIYILAQEKERIRKNKQVYIFRPCMIHGPGNKGNLNLLFQFVSKGLPWPLGAYSNERSYTSIGNLVYIVERFLTSPIASGIYNIGDDDAIGTNALIRMMNERMGKKTRILRIPCRIVGGAARMGTLFSLPLNTERLRKLTEDYRVSNQKVKDALGISHLPYLTREGFERTFDSFIKR